ncbi:hypothetical protein HYS94_01025 [Candidatus Daviesbacteria bacterium]|nr:hypothetical protein [Candidatus Daviesbacteria bacterium]
MRERLRTQLAIEQTTKLYGAGVFLARQALFQKYGEASQYQDLLAQKLTFATPEAMHDVEQADIHKKGISIDQMLLEEGVPEKVLDQYFSTSRRNPFYSNYEEPAIYLPDSLFRYLASSEKAIQFDALRSLGGHLIREDIRTLAHRVHPNEFGHGDDNRLWALIFRGIVNDIFGEAARYFKGKNRDRFRRLKSHVMYFFTPEGMANEDIRIVYVGAKVVPLFPDQPFTGAKTALGVDLDAAFVQCLAEPVEKRYIELLQEQGIMSPNGQASSRPPEDLRPGDELLFSEYIHSELREKQLELNNPS